MRGLGPCWRAFETKLLAYRKPFALLKEARLTVADYLDAYFTLHRRHSVLDYRAPYPVESELPQNLASCTVRFH